MCWFWPVVGSNCLPEPSKHPNLITPISSKFESSGGRSPQLTNTSGFVGGEPLRPPRARSRRDRCRFRSCHIPRIPPTRTVPGSACAGSGPRDHRRPIANHPHRPRSPIRLDGATLETLRDGLGGGDVRPGRRGIASSLGGASRGRRDASRCCSGPNDAGPPAGADGRDRWSPRPSPPRRRPAGWGRESSRVSGEQRVASKSNRPGRS